MARGEKAQRPPKQEDILATVQACIEARRFLDTRHSSDRKSERSIMQLEILQVLKRGHHVPRRDRYEEALGNLGWSYAIEGKTIDDRFLRVIVALDEETRTIIVTAVDLDA
jgi:hypothetical protein